MHSQAPQDLWLPTGWPSSVTSGWSAQCTVHSAHLKRWTNCTNPTHCTSGWSAHLKCPRYFLPFAQSAHIAQRDCPMSHHESVQSLHNAHITHSTNCMYPTHSLLCWRYTAQYVCTLPIVNLLLPQSPVFGDLSSMWAILKLWADQSSLCTSIPPWWNSSDPQIHNSCWWHVSQINTHTYTHYNMCKNQFWAKISPFIKMGTLLKWL